QNRIPGTKHQEPRTCERERRTPNAERRTPNALRSRVQYVVLEAVMTKRMAQICCCLVCCGVAAAAQALKYPQPRKGDVVETYFGTQVADPYRWMEDLNSGEVKQWVDAENAVTVRYLDALPLRKQLNSWI